MEEDKCGISVWLYIEASPLLPDRDFAGGKIEKIEERGICTSLSGVLGRDTSAGAIYSIK